VRESLAVASNGPVVLDAAGAFESMAAAFAEAARTRSALVSTSHYSFAGRLARATVVGRGLSRALERPFAHLLQREPPEVAAQLQLELWEEAATGVGCEGCVVPASPTGHVMASASTDGRFVVYSHVHTRVALDRVRNHAVGWVSASDDLLVYEQARPLAGPLLLWLSDHGVHAAHAGLVARNGRGILCGGPSGSGKSTVALICAQAGFDYLADDHVALESSGDGAFLGHALFGSANLKPDHLRRLPLLARHAIPPRQAGEDKSLLLLSDFFPTRLPSSVTIAAVALPRVVPSPTTTLRPASKLESALRLAPSSMFILPHARGLRAGFDQLTRLAQSVPSYWLDLGPDLDEIPTRMDEILARSDD
jgi:hypothetical protein